tara:strand:- start:230 stop:1591 length:1362 start_codon:yes stop_codon:yes gene_type:complete
MGLKLRSNKIPSVTFSNLPATVDEGQSISPIVSIANVDNTIVDNANLSFNVYWEISGVGIASTDFENVGADGNPDSGTTLTGYVNLTGTTTSKQFPIGIRSDNFADLNVNETATFSIYSDAFRTALIQSDTFIINDTSMGEPEFDFLLVGGGGKGGRCIGQSAGTISQHCAGGGGAGGVLVVTNEPIGIGSTIYCRVAPTQTSAANGFNSFLSENDSNGTVLHTIKGGGKGAGDGFSGGTLVSTYAANPFGASGGGGAGYYNGDGAGSGDYGNDGGDGQSAYGGGGGGGGFGSAGEDAISGAYTSRAGDGGSGYDISNFFSELSGMVAGGGGGGAWYTRASNGDYSEPPGSGNDGGGDGGDRTAGGDAVDNTGGGGGGASPQYSGIWPNHSASLSPGGDGGSGVIYLKYIAPEPLFTYSGTQTVTEYIVSSGGGTKKYWVHKLTTSGELTRTS